MLMKKYSWWMVIVGLAVAMHASGATIEVDNSLGDLVDDVGVNQSGDCSLREALDNINGQDQANDDCESAAPSGDVDTIVFNGVAMITLDDSQANFITDETMVIEGPITIDGGNHNNFIFTMALSGGDLTMNQVTLQNNNTSAINMTGTTYLTANGCAFNSNTTTGDGAAIRGSTSGTIWINGSSFTGNDAGDQGGAIYKGSGAELFVSLSSFTNNNADRGGAIYFAGTGTDDEVIIDASTFQLNTSDGTDSAADGGGAIYIQSTTSAKVVSIIGCVFGGPALGNTAERRGGAIYINSSAEVINTDPTNLLAGGIIACDFTGNAANGPAGNEGLGGAIYNQGTLHVLNSVFDGNSSTNSGGGAIGDNQGSSGTTLVVSNSTFNNNTAGTDGGAISLFNGIGDASIVNSTLSGNTAGNSGREIFADGDAVLTNTIIANTSAGANCAGTGAFTDGGGNLNFDGGPTPSCGLASGSDPLLGSLTLNPGPLPIRTMDLGGGSPALGTGDPAACSSYPVLSLDGRGIPRPTNCDIGAFEGGDAARLVINEIDYDQGATDDHEFIEIMNAGSDTISLGAVAIELIDGTGGGAAPSTAPIALPAVDLAPGDFFVVCGQTGNGVPLVNCDLDVSPDTDLIEDGNASNDDPDAVGLRLSGMLVDTVSYEGDTGHPYTEGSGVGLFDDPAEAFLGISRTTDGADSDSNNTDFASLCSTPGLPNSALSTNCTMVPVELMSFVVE